MTDSVLVQVKVKPEQKAQAEQIFANAGLGMSDAIRLFLQQTINAGDIPFVITARQPSAKLMKAIQQAEADEGTLYDTPDDLFAEWDKQSA